MRMMCNVNKNDVKEGAELEDFKWGGGRWTEDFERVAKHHNGRIYK